MNKSTSNECVAQGAATWNEREEHMRIMKVIDGVAYWHETHYTTDEEWAMMSDLPSNWSERKTKVLPEKEVLYILSCNNLEEIRTCSKDMGELSEILYVSIKENTSLLRLRKIIEDAINKTANN